MYKKKSFVTISIVVLITIIFFLCYYFSNNKVLVGIHGISAGVRDEKGNLINIKLVIWRNDYYQLDRFIALILGKRKNPCSGKDWGIAFFYVVKNDSFFWKTQTYIDCIFIHKNNFQKEIKFDSSSPKTIYYTDREGNLRGYVLNKSKDDEKIDSFLKERVTSTAPTKTTSDYLDFWEELQKKNAAAETIFPIQGSDAIDRLIDEDEIRTIKRILEK